MIKKYIIFFSLCFVLSCSNIEFVIKENNNQDQLNGKTKLFFFGGQEEKFSREVYSFFGNTENHEYILETIFLEKKENRIVKENQVAKKIDYTLEVKYDLFYKTSECKVFSKKIITRFFFTPKSAGYNFGSDRAFQKLYISSIKKNIQNFIDLGPFDQVCL